MKKYIIFLVLLLAPVVIALGDGTDTKDNYTAGTGALASLTTGRANTALGAYNLRNLTTGWGNIGIGMMAGEDITTDAHKLRIGNGYYKTNGIFGDLSTGYYGLNNSSPTATLDMDGGRVVLDSLWTSTTEAASLGEVLELHGSIDIAANLRVRYQATFDEDVTITQTLTVNGIMRMTPVAAQPDTTGMLGGEMWATTGDSVYIYLGTSNEIGVLFP